MNSTRSLVGLLLILSCAPTASEAGLVGSRVETVALTGGLGETVDRLARGGSGPLWAVWSVPMIPGRHHACCGDWDDRGRESLCKLESHNRSHFHDTDFGSVEGGELQILLRLDDDRVDEVRAYTADCRLDAEGVRVIRLEGVGPVESVDYLSSIVDARGREERGAARRRGHRAEDRRQTALSAIAYHAGAAADRALANWSRPPTDAELREQVAFWLGAARGHAALDDLRRMLRDDPSGDVREQAVFGISLIDHADALATLIDVARNGKQAELRGTAVFWLSQKAGERAVQVLHEIVEDDPDAEMREQAVFAISQLPHGEGVSMLIKLARSNRHREVREQAMFWLGQSDDPRALDLFEEILVGD